MQNLLIAIFAHPDDESFGPSGTLLKLASQGWGVHLICLTDGDAGQNVDNVPNLAAVRQAEWQKSAQILGATSTHPLHYPDSKLDVVDPSQLLTSLEAVITDILASYDQSVKVSYMTFEPNGLTDHPDHIVASRLTTQLAKRAGNTSVWYFCLDQTQAPLSGTSRYQPRARQPAYITDRIDISPWIDDKHRMIDCHVSQRNDAVAIKSLPHTIECFHIADY